MFDLNPLTAISREVREWMDKLEQRREARNQSTRTALKSLSLAVLETRAYLGQLSSGKKRRNLERERDISQLWNDAHMELRGIDASLADRCFAKADHWADPSLWNKGKIRQYNITLDSMSDAVRDLLTRSVRQ